MLTGIEFAFPIIVLTGMRQQNFGGCDVDLTIHHRDHGSEVKFLESSKLNDLLQGGQKLNNRCLQLMDQAIITEPFARIVIQLRIDFSVTHPDLCYLIPPVCGFLPLHRKI